MTTAITTDQTSDTTITTTTFQTTRTTITPGASGSIATISKVVIITTSTSTGRLAVFNPDVTFANLTAAVFYIKQSKISFFISFCF